MGEYEDVIKLIDAEHETYVGTASQYIPRLRTALEKENKSKEEIKDRILNDCEKYWTRQTIMDALGEDFKDVKQRQGGKQKGKLKAEILTITNEGRTETELPNKDLAGKIQGESINTTSDERLEQIGRRLAKLGMTTKEPEPEPTAEDLQIQLNDAQTKLEQERTERIRIMQLLDKERERAKELESTKNHNFTPAIEMVQTQTKTDNETMPTSEHRKIIGQLNSRILELKDKLSEVSTYEEIIEIKNQKIVLVIEATNLKSVEVDEAKSRRLNQ